MKTNVISMCLLLALAACGKSPEDPDRSGKPVLPGNSLSLPLSTYSPHEATDETHGRGSAPSPSKPEPVTRWM
jgi:hypothetical protein